MGETLSCRSLLTAKMPFLRPCWTFSDINGVSHIFIVYSSHFTQCTDSALNFFYSAHTVHAQCTQCTTNKLKVTLPLIFILAVHCVHCACTGKKVVCTVCALCKMWRIHEKRLETPFFPGKYIRGGDMAACNSSQQFGRLCCYVVVDLVAAQR